MPNKPCHRAIAALILALLPATLAAVDFQIAPIVFIEKVSGSEVEPSVAEDLLTELSKRDFGGNVTFKMTGGDEAPASIVEALRLSVNADAKYIFYGVVRQDIDSYTAEIKLLDCESQKVGMSFYSSDRLDRYDRMIEDLTTKIDSYLRIELGFGPRPEKKVERNLLGISGGLGYWTPMNGSWLQYQMGIFLARGGIRYIPTKPFSVIGARASYLILGADLEYALGMNQPGYEVSYLHTALLKVGASFAYDFATRHRLSFSAKMGLRMDWLAQTQLYQGTVMNFSAVPVFYLGPEYAYRIRSDMELGVDLEMGIAMYNNPLISFAPAISFVYWIGGKK
jgi:hypothetical protein